MSTDRDRCSRCGRYGHTDANHNTAVLVGKRPITMFVLAYDVSGCISSWHGPLTWANAVGVARFIEATDEFVGRTRVTSTRPNFVGDPDPLPADWSDYHPFVARSRRLVPNHARIRGAA